MESISAQNLDLVKAVQALLVRQGTAVEGGGGALLALLGQDVELLLLAQTPEGITLKLPSGQTVTAQGELPYPEGTQLRARVLAPSPEEPSLRLQLREASPPALPAILSPLLQSEAQTLAARLLQQPPAAGMEPLMRLLSQLVDLPVGKPSFPPATEQLQAALQQLPSDQTASLGRILGVGTLASAPELATALQSLFQDLAAKTATPPPFLNAPSVAASPEDMGLKELIQQVLARFQTLAAEHPEIPATHREALLQWLRESILPRSQADGGPATKPGSPADPPIGSPKSQAPSHPTTEALPRAASLQAPALLHPSSSKAEAPESWEAWIRGTVSTLTNPATSPQEAPFHALQAKEGTAYFEIPLPWAQASPLQIWVEADAPEERRSGRDATKRVLLGLAFSHLGETRLGMAQGAFGLQIRIWTEHPEALEAERKAIEEELQALGKPVNLKIHTLTYNADGTIPSIRSLVIGPSLSALG